MTCTPGSRGRASPQHPWRRTLVVSLASVVIPGAIGSAAATPVGDAVDRPSLATRHAARVVLLGAAQAGPRLVAVGERGVIVLSDDGGISWRQAPAPVSVTLTAVRFADANNGYAVGHAGIVLTTTDGGQSWTRRLDGKRIAQLALEAAGGDAAAVKAAQRLVADGADKPLLDVLVFDARRALVVGAYGLAFVTTDGGQTWSSWMARLDNPAALHHYALRSRGARLLIAGEQGLVLASDDAGRSFRRLTTPYKGSFFTAELGPDAEIVVAGLRGNVWRSSDGGSRWARLELPAPVSVTGSALRQDGSLILVNQAGQVLALRDGALVSINVEPLPPLTGVLAKSDGGLLALTVRGALALPAAPPQTQGRPR